jgi:hypothetical protein
LARDFEILDSHRGISTPHIGTLLTNRFEGGSYRIFIVPVEFPLTSLLIRPFVFRDPGIEKINMEA